MVELAADEADVTPRAGDLPSMTDADLQVLIREFVNSGYRGDEYADWPIERRLDGFLRRRGLIRHANNGDICNVIIDRVMTHVSVTRPVGVTTRSG